MRVVHTGEELRSLLKAHREAGGKIGFVPTMGALHEGHGALLRRSAHENTVTVLSVFVNPTQFGPGEDFSRYPRTLEADGALAKKEGAAYLFAPAVEEVYPPDWRTFIEVEGVTVPLCGAYRPGHFRGVATVVYRLFSLVGPDVAYFGQKDLQQCLVIQRMVRDLGLPLRVEVVPTVREEDGLALSSRNRYLSAEERARALVIFRALGEATEAFRAGERNAERLRRRALGVLSAEPAFRVQYCEVRGLPNLDEISELGEPGGQALAIAGFFGSTRLIDNVVL